MYILPSSILEHCVKNKEELINLISKEIALVVACDNKWGIGKNGTLPWHFKKDLQWFKSLTTSGEKENIVLMGYNTWLSLPKKPLPFRKNFVFTSKHKKELEKHHAICCDSIETFLKHYQQHKENIGKIFIIGGRQIYNLFLESNLIEKIYITHIKKTFDCDTFFPMKEDRLERIKQHHSYEENGTTITTVEYRIKKNDFAELKPEHC